VSQPNNYLRYFKLNQSLERFALEYQSPDIVLKLNTYTVSFNTQGGSTVPAQTVSHGGKATEPDPAPVLAGHTLEGWYKEEACTNLWDFNTDTVTDDMTLYAKWTPNKPGPTPVPPSGGVSSDGNMDNAYRVLFNDGATTLYIVTDLSAGDKLTKPEDPVKDGYTFAGWHKDSACTQAWDFNDGITGDMTLYAKWTAQATATPTVTPTATATVTPTVTATATTTATPTGDASPAQTSQPDNEGSNGDTTATSGISLPYLIGGILILLLAILLLLFLLLRHTVTFLIPTGGELEEYRIKVWHGKYIDPGQLPELLRTAAWYRDPARQERWDFNEDRVTKSIELYLG
ncbi:MAG TPA: InlB B-repeat-containing protein, partial [Methanocorpusculum sp.]|nr:InlB B-repeat-containing protein [Methanocorpusculum sp.]